MKLLRFLLAFLLLAGAAPAVADDLEDAYQNLQKAETQKDAAQVKLLAAKTHALAAQAISAPAPQSADEKDAWTKRVAYAKEIDLHTEYALFAAAAQGPAAVTVDLISTLEQQNPKSQYLDAAYGSYLLALSQTGAASKITGVAQKGIEHLPDNEDLLMVLADAAMTQNQNDRALRHAMRLTSVLQKHAKPEGMAAADWERRRATLLGRGFWISGVIHGQQSVFAASDKELRAALPLIKDNQAMMGAALFYLGVANYQLGRLTLNKAQVLEAGRFSEQAAAIDGPYQSQAWRNALACKGDAAKMR